MGAKNLLERVYDATRSGLDIITDLVTGIDDGVINHKKAFRLRPDERTPSAYLYPPKASGDCWHVKDYGLGDCGGFFSPIDLYMWMRGYTQSQFRMALEELAEQYGVEELLSASVNKPETEVRAALPEERGAMTSVSLFEGPGGVDLSCWGDGVKAEHLTTYGWKVVSEVRIPKGDKVYVRKPTPTYPIFAQECHYVDEQGQPQVFYKVYEPKNFDKAHRFLVAGKKPKDYIYGLSAVRKVYEENGEQKLDVLLLVSGGSDAIVAHVKGYLSVWRDSEVKLLSDSDYNLLMKYCHKLVVIPDIDPTGVRVGQRLALSHLGIYMAWMTPDDMGGLHDNRGRERKDLRDYCHLHPGKKDFEQLIGRAIKAQFWSVSVNKDREEVYSLSRTSLDYFLELNGFCTIKDETRKEPQYIRIVGCVVQRITPKAIVTFLKEWMNAQGLPQALQDKVKRSRDLPSNSSCTLRERDDLDFTRSTATSQRFYFRNAVVDVTAEKITSTPYSMIADGKYVWEDSVIQHDFKLLKPQFTMAKGEDERYHITITEDARSKYFRFIRNTSRLYWRKQDEEGLELTPEELAEEEQCNVAKMANIGYMLHSEKSESEAWATICQDAKMGETEKDCNGRSGKSFYVGGLSTLLETFPIEARSASITENRFLFDGVTPNTDLIVVDECNYNLNFDFFFGKITGPFRGEEKGNHPFLIPFKQSPKFWFGTNYVLRRHDPSTEGRIWLIVFGDYYHVIAKGNDYRETRTIADDFGENLMGTDYAEADWQSDIAFMLQCLQFYLSLPKGERKQISPLKQIERREHMVAVGKDFKEWADDYFSENGGNLDRTIRQRDVLLAYNSEASFPLKMKKLTLKLKEYCALADHIRCLNPVSVTGAAKDGERLFQYENGKQEQCYHVQSEKAAATIQPTEPVQTELPFHTEPSVPSETSEDCPF
jgi:hypothetical protein